MFQISRKLKKLKTKLKQFNKETYLPELRVSLALEEELKETQRQMLDSNGQQVLEEKEAQLYKQVYTAQLLEEDAERKKIKSIVARKRRSQYLLLSQQG